MKNILVPFTIFLCIYFNACCTMQEEGKIPLLVDLQSIYNITSQLKLGMQKSKVLLLLNSIPSFGGNWLCYAMSDGDILLYFENDKLSKWKVISEN